MKKILLIVPILLLLTSCTLHEKQNDPFFNTESKCEVIDKYHNTYRGNTTFRFVLNCLNTNGDDKFYEQIVNFDTYYNIEIGQILNVNAENGGLQ